ncbi:hypothetical protein B0H16DRAFT_1884341 [Mycena metata]|uniref:Uncharacterized protein n=1 Tax=Mycena metata TaxID=1033252 RepID=A0AAD7JDY8_9AGAR|nr:hypothetical protein B0H16DRAFT_1884341 [Mycena metata]
MQPTYARVYGIPLCRSAAHRAPQSALSRSQSARPARCHFASVPTSAPPHRLRLPVDPMPPPSVGPPCAITLPLRPLGLSSARRLFATPAAPTATLPTPPVATRAFPFRPSPRRIQGDADKMTMEIVSTGSKCARRRPASSCADDIEFLKNFNIVVMSVSFPGALLRQSSTVYGVSFDTSPPARLCMHAARSRARFLLPPHLHHFPRATLLNPHHSFRPFPLVIAPFVS